MSGAEIGRGAGNRAVANTGVSRGKSSSFLYAVAFLCFYIPQDYAVSDNIQDLWVLASLVVGGFSTLLLLAHYGIDGRVFSIVFFFLTFYVFSSALSASDGSALSIISYTARGIGFCSLCLYGFQRNGKACLAGFILAGSIMCIANYATYLQYGDIVGGMQHGSVSFKGTVTTQHWFLLSSDNGTLF